MPKKEGEPYVYEPWPSWCDGPNGEREIFNSEAEVPAGWTHHDAAPKAPKAKGSKKPALDL